MSSPAAREQELLLGVGHDEHGLQAAKGPVRPPVFDELHGGALQVSVELLQLALEPREEGEGVRHAPGEPRQDLVLVEFSHFAGAVLHDGLAEAHLAVGGHGDLSVAAPRRAP